MHPGFLGHIPLCMPWGQHTSPFITGSHFFITISCWSQDCQGNPLQVTLQMPPAIKPMKRMNPTTIKNQEIKAKNLPGASFLNFASSSVPARIASNEIAKICILCGLKNDYSLIGFRRSRSVHSSLKTRNPLTFTNIKHFQQTKYFRRLKHHRQEVAVFISKKNFPL
jgi:hypothetical protein